MSLLEKLLKIQTELGLSDHKFAQLLGINNVLWTLTRQEKRPIRYEVLKAVMRTFPKNADLRAAVLAHLQGEVSAEQPQEIAAVG
jgi:hypothetical protein